MNTFHRVLVWLKILGWSFAFSSSKHPEIWLTLFLLVCVIFISGNSNIRLWLTLDIHVVDNRYWLTFGNLRYIKSPWSHFCWPIHFAIGQKQWIISTCTCYWFCIVEVAATEVAVNITGIYLKIYQLQKKIYLSTGFYFYILLYRLRTIVRLVHGRCIHQS